MIAQGNEGAVAKNLQSPPYIASNSRRRDGWVKIKRTNVRDFSDDGIREIQLMPLYRDMNLLMRISLGQD